MRVSAALRKGAGEDAIDGVVPQHVALPETPEELGQVLAEASRDRQLTVLRGNGSKLGWGRVPSRIDLVVGTKKLDRLLAHRYGDMTATVQAGMPLAVSIVFSLNIGSTCPSKAHLAMRPWVVRLRPTRADRCATASAHRATC